jgi:hypothetical protein
MPAGAIAKGEASTKEFTVAIAPTAGMPPVLVAAMAMPVFISKFKHSIFLSIFIESVSIALRYILKEF